MFKAKKFVSMVMDSGFIFMNLTTKEKSIIEFNVEKMPNTPFFHCLYEKQWGYGEEMKSWAKAVKGLKRSRIYMIVNDDILEVDKIMLFDFLKKYIKVRSVEFLTQNRYMSESYQKYIALTASSRVLTASYVNDGAVCKVKHYDIHNYLFGDILDVIKDNNEIEYEAIPVLYNGCYCDIEGAEHVSKEDILNHYLHKFEERNALS